MMPILASCGVQPSPFPHTCTCRMGSPRCPAPGASARACARRGPAAAGSELCAAFADKIPFYDGMRAVMCCADQKAQAQFLFKLHAALERTHDQAVADIASEACGDLGNEAHMLCNGRCARGAQQHKSCNTKPPTGVRRWKPAGRGNAYAKVPTIQRGVLQCPVPFRAVSRAARRLHASC
jgi:hypothetical protein